MNKSLAIWAFFLLIGCSALLSFAFFSVAVSDNQLHCEKIRNQIKNLSIKVDSLENVINTSFKEKKDTTIIQVCPQEVKIYYKQNI